MERKAEWRRKIFTALWGRLRAAKFTVCACTIARAKKLIFMCRLPPVPMAGGDSRLREMLFRGSVQDPLGHMADTRAGIMSAIVGIAANKSMKEGRTISVEELVPELF